MHELMLLLRASAFFVTFCAIWVGVPVAQEDCPDPVWPPYDAYIFGQEGWYDIGDTIQFVGDSNIGCLGDAGCGDLDGRWDSCEPDKGFNFRKVSHVDVEECTYTEGDTCYVAVVRCCFWDPDPCIQECSSCCEPHDLCKSFWRVIYFHEDGETGRGCWELRYVTDCDDWECEEGLSMCSTIRKWCDN